ncbi:hypothetical protein E2C01_065255 [Portunus trituberculatus]|uniref:Uncharacterized protein n=1 Tax=Portunus trituberculatus TaxID=210409 RepID=A0A5B7HQK0_PORTR|nr:hypothetical protein [Portunus trituberculatus]
MRTGKKVMKRWRKKRVEEVVEVWKRCRLQGRGLEELGGYGGGTSALLSRSLEGAAKSPLSVLTGGVTGERGTDTK